MLIDPRAIIIGTMDLREYIKEHPDFVFGHESVAEPLNVKRELSKYYINPLESNLVKFQKEETILLDEINRFRQSYDWYILSLERVICATSVARRAQQELRYLSRNRQYSARRKIISHKYREMSKYMELDFQNLIFHSCLVLNRSLTASRPLFSSGKQPSFTSFSKHREFFKINRFENSSLNMYADYMQNDTAWFDIPLLLLRDKYLMHAIDPHMAFLGWPDNWNLELCIVIPIKAKLDNIKVIRFNPRRLARDIHQHFCQIKYFGKSVC